MSAYTKLFSSILDSSIWQEDDHTRLVWITLLAMADQHGEVQASIPGIAKRAGVPLASAESAIEKLSSPDKYSRTPDNEGRRIAKIDGGWEILNHAKYRFEASLEDRKVKAVERQRRHRSALQKKEGENPTTCDSALQTVTQRDEPLPVTQSHAPVTVLTDKQKQSQSHTHTKTPKELFDDPWHLDCGLSVPEKFRTQECLEALKTWVAYKKERKEGYKRIGLQSTLTKLSNEFDSISLPEAIQNSMASGWKGIFQTTPRLVQPSLTIGSQKPIHSITVADCL